MAQGDPAKPVSVPARATPVQRDESENVFRILFEASPDAIFVEDLDGNVLDVNPAACRLHGMTRAELIGQNVLALVAPESREQVARDFPKLVNGEWNRCEGLSWTKDGREVPVEIRTNLIESAGKPALLLHVRDISRQKRVEAALRESERRLAHALEATTEGIWDWNIRTGHVYYSPRWMQSLGYSPEEVPPHVSFWERIVHPEDMPRVRQALEEHLAGRTPLYRCENRLRTKSGPWRWNLDQGKVVEWDADGRPLRMVGTDTDIGERKRAEETLRRSEARNRALLHAIPDLIFVLRGDGTYVDYKEDEQARFYVSPGAFLGKKMRDVLPPEVAGPCREALQRALRTAAVQRIEYRLILGDEPRDFEARLCVIGSDEVLAIVRDVTERKRVEAQLRQTHKIEAIGRLSGGIAHDFNNILTAITGYSDLLLDRLPDASLRQYAGLIQQSAERAAGLTRQLLALGRKQALQPRIVDLNALLAEMDAMLRPLLGRRVTLVTRPADGLGRVHADPIQIEQVILNLALNARDAMPEGGILTLETANATLPDASGQRQGDAAPGECVQLVVRDTGRGMNLHEKEHLFEPFFTTKEPGKGTGLGLATCYGIIKQSGGHIEIESAPGQGTTVHIFLPRVQAVLAAPVSAPQPAELPRGSERVLLVEDEPAVRQLASLLLRELGYRVVEASEGAEALRLLREVGEGPFDLLITDVIMPAMGGRELAERAVELQPGLKVLYMSGYTGDSLSQQGALVPGVVLLEKPFHSGTLARKVRQALG